MLNDLLHPTLQTVAAIGVALMLTGFWTIGRMLERMSAQIDRMNRYLRHLAWHADRIEGNAMEYWHDPGA